MNKNLKSIDLRWNELGNKGGKFLLEAIKDNESIVNLEINGNNISDNIRDEIFKILGRNRDKENLSPEDIRKLKNIPAEAPREIKRNYPGESQLIQRQEPYSDNRSVIGNLEKIIEQETLKRKNLEAELGESQQKIRADKRFKFINFCKH